MNEIEFKIENSVVDFVQNIVDCELLVKNEYLQFVYEENVDTDTLLFTLNSARLIHKLYLLSSEMIEKNEIKPNSLVCKPFTKDSLLSLIKEMQIDIDLVLKKLKSIYDESFDIDDEEEYSEIQKYVREKRKRIRELKKLCDSYSEVIENYLPIVFTQSISSGDEENISVSNIPEADKPKNFVVKDITDNKEKISTTKSPGQIESNTDNFNLKEAMIDIFLSEDEKITQNKGHKGELTSYILQKLIKRIYGKSIHFWEISEILNQDSSFICTGPESYVLSGNFTSNKTIKLDTLEGFIPDADHLLNKTEQSTKENQNINKSPAETNEAFNLKDVIVDIFLSDAAFINSNKNSKGGLTANSLQKIIQKFHRKFVSIFEISKLLSNDPLFLSIGKGYYIIDQKRLSKVNQITDESEGKDADNLDLSNENNIKIEKIILELNGNTVDVYDCNDAWQKICEFAIRCKPFTMTYIFKSDMDLNQKKLFYRQPASIEGYIRLSNNLQVLKVENYSELKITVEKLKKYCDLDDSMITIKEI